MDEDLFRDHLPGFNPFLEEEGRLVSFMPGGGLIEVGLGPGRRVDSVTFHEGEAARHFHIQYLMRPTNAVRAKVEEILATGRPLEPRWLHSSEVFSPLKYRPEHEEGRALFCFGTCGAVEVLYDPQGLIISHRWLAASEALDCLDAAASLEGYRKDFAAPDVAPPGPARTRLEARVYAATRAIRSRRAILRGGEYTLEGVTVEEASRLRWSYISFGFLPADALGLGEGRSACCDVVDWVRFADMVDYWDADFDTVRDRPLDTEVAMMALEQALRFYDQGNEGIEASMLVAPKNERLLTFQPQRYTRSAILARIARMRDQGRRYRSWLSPSRDGRENKLIDAVARNDGLQVRDLLAAGGDPNAVDAHGRPALLVAVGREYSSNALSPRRHLLDRLLDAGADPAFGAVGLAVCRRMSCVAESEADVRLVESYATRFGLAPDALEAIPA